MATADPSTAPTHHSSRRSFRCETLFAAPLLVCCSNLSMKTITCQDRLRTHTQHQEMLRDKRRGFTSRAGERREHGRHRPVLGGRAAPLLHHWQRILTHCTVLAVTTPGNAILRHKSSLREIQPGGRPVFSAHLKRFALLEQVQDRR